MKQILQSFETGVVQVASVPVPAAGASRLLVQTQASLISAGTERALVSFGRSNLIEKARQQPDRVRQVIDKARTDGIVPTLDAVRSKLRQPTTLGYCSAGVVVEAGASSRGFAPGDRVATNGPHGEFVSVPWTLAARIPDAVPFDHAAFTPLAAIALQGIRLADPTLGETVVVYGLGLVGLLSVQLLRANGCHVVGIDRDPARVQLAARFGARAVLAGEEDPTAHVLDATGGLGADAVLLTLASNTTEPVNAAARMARTRGRIVLVGVTGLALQRDQFYRKELTFQVSCSYGPGRYDAGYEERGQDYPFGHVRWTAQRNFQAVLDLMAAGSLDPAPLITHRYPLDEAAAAYDTVTDDRSALGILLEYPQVDRPDLKELRYDTVRTDVTTPAAGASLPAANVAGVIGAGTFAQRIMLPAITKAGFRVAAVASSSGTTAALAAKEAGAQVATSDVDRILDDPSIGTIFVLTRHDSHAALAARALAAGKNVFVEKPLALHVADLTVLRQAVQSSAGILTVGFNRRFAPLTEELLQRLQSATPLRSMIITVNAGALPADHWTRDPIAGGGRIAGEACHFIDLARALSAAPIADGRVLAASDARGLSIEDIAHLQLRFDSGATAVIHYLANGSPAFPKERIEVFVDGRTYVIDNWRSLRPGNRRPRLLARQDKGHDAQLKAWREAVLSGVPPIPYEELFEVSEWTLRLAAAARGDVPHDSLLRGGVEASGPARTRVDRDRHE